MIIRAIRLRNFMCYEGETVLELRPKLYAIFARHVADPERSNFCGKSTIPEAINFALYGEHRHRTEDGWITAGQKSGSVHLTFDDGTVVERARDLGKSTRLTYCPPTGTAFAKQDEAQELVLQRVGLTRDDYAATCYFAQRQLAKLVLADPKDRMEIVSSWLRLAPLERAEKATRDRVAKLILQAADNASRVRALVDQSAHDLEQLGVKTLEELGASCAKMDAEVAQAKAAADAAMAAFQAGEQARVLRSKAADYEALKVEGRQARVATTEVPVEPAQAAHGAAKETERVIAVRYRAAEGEAKQKRQLAQGQFDGRCPIAELECPVKDVINGRRTKNAELSRAADAAFAEVHKEYDAAVREERRLDAEAQAARRAAERFADLAKRAVAMRQLAEAAAALPPAGDEGAARAEVDRTRSAHQTLVEWRARGQAALDRAARVRETVAKAGVEAARLDEELGTVREAAALLGKQGAQRRVAEEALAEIELGANEMLRGCGIDLSVELRWAREGTGLAGACDACGNPFPASARVKECARCGAARGPNLINRLTVELSARSGAAEDLAGAALQLSASAWLRADRESAWSTAVIDEPFGMLDAAHRRAFSGGLVRMLGEAGFSQGFVIAHHASVLDALPGRIEVVSDGRRSTARVVA